MFLPVTPEEVAALGWQKPDIILVTGDTYIDSPYIGAAALGKLLVSKGYRVGIIAQPDIKSGKDITKLGEPELFWGVTGGSVDSMVANYTALNKRRKSDDYTPGGKNNRRPDRAVIAYCNLIRQHFKGTAPLIIGGIEASLRRVAHYDFWTDKIRRSILFDAKADYLIYGMGEKTILETAAKLKKGKPLFPVKGLCYISDQPEYKYTELPSYEECASDKDKFTSMFRLFYENNDPLTARGLYQKTGDRYLIQNPPQMNPGEKELDEFYDLGFERETHPFYAKQGQVRALDTIRFSINTHRGCYGECNFCAIAVHQGRTVVSRSQESITREAEDITRHGKFKGIINDLGGPTANMYGYECDKKMKLGVCDDKRCLFPDRCPAMKPDHKPQLELLEKVEKLKGVRKVFVASGIRYDLAADDKKEGYNYIRKIAKSHTSGQLKIAPEHSDDKILELMGKPGKKSLEKFRNLFFKFSKEAGKEQYLTYYFIAAHPGCSDKEMNEVKLFAGEKLGVNPGQVQIFTPTPSTWSTLMYYTGKNPFSGEKVFVEKSLKGKENQKSILTGTTRDKSLNERRKTGKRFKDSQRKYRPK